MFAFHMTRETKNDDLSETEGDGGRQRKERESGGNKEE